MRLIYGIPFFISSLSLLIAAGFAVRRRRARGAWYLILMCLSAAVYSTFEGLRYLAPNLETDMVMTYLQFLGTAASIPFAILFTMAVFRMEAWINTITIALLSIGAVATLILVCTDPLHHLVYSDYRFMDNGPFPMRGYTPGVFWWAIVVYDYLLMVAFTLLLVHVLQTAKGIYRIQASLFLAGAAVVWFVNAVYISGGSPVPNMDISPLAFVIVAGTMLIGFFRYNLLDVLPIAREHIFAGLKDSVLVLDINNHLLDLNPAAENLLGIHGEKSFGFDIGRLLEHRTEILRVVRENTPGEVSMDIKGRRHHFAIRFSPLTDRRGRNMGRIVILQDITKRKQAEEAIYESERLRGILEMAGAICHDLSQPAMASGGYTELLLLDTSENEPIYAPLTKLIEQVDKIGDINKKLLKITQYKPENG